MASVRIPERSTGRSVALLPLLQGRMLSGLGRTRLTAQHRESAWVPVNILPGPFSGRGPGQDRALRTTERNKVCLVFSSPSLPAGRVTRSLRSRGGSVHVAMDGDQAWRRNTTGRKSTLRPSSCVRKGSSGRQETRMRPRQALSRGDPYPTTNVGLRGKGQRHVTQYRNPRVAAVCQF